MKNSILFLLLYTGMLHAQVPLKKDNPFLKEMREISTKEMKAHERLAQKMNTLDSFTVATNNFDVHFYRCEWRVDPAILYINGKVTSYFAMQRTSTSISYDLKKSLVVDSVIYHGSTISFVQTTQQGLDIVFPAPIAGGQSDSVSVYYQGVPDASGFGSFIKSTHSGIPIMWTLSEPYGAREWWPCKNGLTDKADSIDIIITHPAAYTASSNGMLTSEVIAGPDKIATYQHRYPIASYLVAFAVTNYKVSTDTISMNGKPLLYKGYYYPELYDDWKFFESFGKNFLQLFSRLYGDYPFAKEKYAQTGFGWGGGMEHQTNSFITHRGPNLQAHELMHQWFGDKVTCGSWKDIWLNEGFATYGTALTLEYIYPQYHRDYMETLLYYAVSDSTGSVYVDDTTSVARIFSGRLSYYKGAYVVHMLRWKIGDSAFYRGARNYLNDPAVAYGFARTADLKRNMENESKKDLTTFFDKWIYGQGYPNYQADWSQNNNKWANVKLYQSTSHPSVSFYDMPVALRFMNATRDTTFVVDHQKSGQQFWLNVGFDADTLMIDPDIHLLSAIKSSKKITGSTINNQLKIFPNPTPDQVNVLVQNPTDKQLNVQLYNTLGQLMYNFTTNFTGRDESIVIPLAKFSRGIYFLKMKSEKNINQTQQVIKR